MLESVYNGLFCCKTRSLAKNNVFFHPIPQCLGIKNTPLLSQSSLFLRRTTHCKQTLMRYVFLTFIFLLSGCADQFASPPIVPVIDAWYQKDAASNFYIVRSDDTIYSIAFAFGLDYRALADANHLSSPYPIYPGQRLRMTHTPAVQYHKLATLPLITHRPLARPYIMPMPSFLRTQPRYQEMGWNRGWHWPVQGRLLQTFSRQPDGHSGISIGGHLGDLVRATSSGAVVYSGDGVRGYGNLIIIKHNDSYLSAYAFNQRNLVAVDDRIRAGAVIARMGQNDAGRTLLYFEIRRNGVAVNPLRYLH